jgi:hypothetical protein
MEYFIFIDIILLYREFTLVLWEVGGRLKCQAFDKF